MSKMEWEKQFIKEYGIKKGQTLWEKYQDAFPATYQDEYDAAIALSDIQQIEQLSAENPLAIEIYLCQSAKTNPLHIRLFQWQQPIPLSDVLPMLENLDLKVNSERPDRIAISKQAAVWISDFSVSTDYSINDINKVKDLFQDAFLKIAKDQVENDGFNKLVLAALLSWREIRILRAYSKYLKQAGFRFSQPYIENTLVAHPDIANHLVQLFLDLHDPKNKKSKADKIEKDILAALDKVSSLDEDYIIRRLLTLIKVTLRTNYFQLDQNKKNKPYLSLKLSSREIPDLPLPKPLYEIFVYSPRFEAIHLRNTKVARGGIRWSDRKEDFRTEILGLMKAQVVKNSVIVPSGAKGGFVLKAIKPNADRAAVQLEVKNCYQQFISGLLDITDNIQGKKFIRPKQVVCHDDIDPYLVVAADKGTATFSDTANEIAEQYGFWLGDAFASGGKTGYDHKKMGITARGAWESIKRHFREFNIDATKAEITVAGIGDMSGDVFGNGALYSKHIKLVAAFDHRHIFLDPNPKPDVSYQERERLFKLPASSWEDYNPKLISKGGGVFKRSLKSIVLTAEIKKVLDIKDDSLTPNELIQAVLRAPVDLIFNGGIGTYIKASYESNADVGDRSNDYCRINGNEIRAKVVGEGGNLGVTQLGRIEYALNQGLINTDFIDNSAGVDCSDHEVNLKILLDQQMSKGKLTLDVRNKLLKSLTKEVADLVLQDNYEQALVMSFSAHHAKSNIGLHIDYIKELEANDFLNRKVEFLPDEKTLLDRKSAGLGLTRPEIAVLLAYTKIYLKQQILHSSLLEDKYFECLLETAFPASVKDKYQAAMNDHGLRLDIMATQLSNQVVNEMGITFVYRVQMETGADICQILRAYVASSQIFETHELKKLIMSLDFKISMHEQYDMLYQIRNLISLSTRWFLYANRLNADLASIINHYGQQVKKLESRIPNLIGGEVRDYLNDLIIGFKEIGLDQKTAEHIAVYRAIYTALNIIEVATENKFDLFKTAEVYFISGEKMNLLWFRDQIRKDSREGHWNVLARLTLRDELDLAQRSLTIVVINQNKSEKESKKLIETWFENNEQAIVRWERLMGMLHSSNNVDYTMFFIALRELIGLVLNSA